MDSATSKQSAVVDMRQDRRVDVPSLSTPPSLVDEYCFVSEIGHGAQGKIYKAVRLADNRTVVIKQLSITSIKSWKEYELFHREADTLKRIHMDGVAAFYDAIDCLDDEPPCSYIVQEYIPGVSLRRMIQDGHRFKVVEVYDILIQTLSILDRLHHHDPPIIHRDIKPSNLMITTNDKGTYDVTIIDFGAVANPQVQGGGSTVAGTFGYMSPEQLMGKPVPASDIYSVGALAVQLFSGKSPADIPVKEFRLIFEPEMQDRPHELVTLLRNMLEPKLEDRFTEIPEIIRQLNAFKNGSYHPVKGNNSIIGYTRDYEQRLQNLDHLCQTGSLELWQQLPDSERKMPVVINDALAGIDDCELAKKYKIRNVTGLKLLCMIVAVALVIVDLTVVLPVMSIELIDIALFLGLLIAGVKLFLYALSIFRSVSDDMSKQALPFGEKEDLDFNKVWMPALIQKGRKGMATIVSVNYLPVASKYIFTPSGSVSNEMMKCEHVILGEPCFEIMYRFNPPDDRRVTDIIHTFVTCTEPEGHYKVGDPLPILYLIEDRYYEDFVYSMPFPVPLGDLRNKVTDSSGSLSQMSQPEKQHIIDIIETGTNVLGAQAAIIAIPYFSRIESTIAALNFLFSYITDDGFKAVRFDCISKCIKLAFGSIYKYAISWSDECVMEQMRAMIINEFSRYLNEDLLELITGDDNEVVVRNILADCLDFVNYNYDFFLMRRKYGLDDASYVSAIYKAIARSIKNGVEYKWICYSKLLSYFASLMGENGSVKKTMIGLLYFKDDMICLYKYLMSHYASRDKWQCFCEYLSAALESEGTLKSFCFGEVTDIMIMNNIVIRLNPMEIAIYALVEAMAVYGVNYIHSLRKFFKSLVTDEEAEWLAVLINACWRLRNKNRNGCYDECLDKGMNLLHDAYVNSVCGLDDLWNFIYELLGVRITENGRLNPTARNALHKSFGRVLCRNASRLPATIVKLIFNQLSDDEKLLLIRHHYIDDYSWEMALSQHYYVNFSFMYTSLIPVLENGLMNAGRFDIEQTCVDTLLSIAVNSNDDTIVSEVKRVLSCFFCYQYSIYFVNRIVESISDDNKLKILKSVVNSCSPFYNYNSGLG